MKLPSEFVNHLKHCIQEEHGIQLSEKASSDIRQTINGAYQAAVQGAEQKRKAADNRYYEQKNMTEKLIGEIGKFLNKDQIIQEEEHVSEGN
ncbi:MULTISPECIES: hypothetical protein [Peribacillus]|uniref:hypothetical protein n=1 Tax=Peribacillus TaxID=2675229 RepID=UPI001F4ECF7B|nr:MULTISPECIES: hypothetical protein [unclassified Peribacillus]MCK1982206.1 hypothetical protein [Peribacillus sp. Aquil_B1]MCK2007442.1 hypothetical protein [Peribacillus sp. Aquil_B8]